MSALWTALHERSHEGLVEDYIKLMADHEAEVKPLREALKSAREALQALDEHWSADYSGPESKLAQARFTDHTIAVWRQVRAALEAK